MRRCLAVVEKAYRGGIEEQYAHILWICWSLLRIGRRPLGILLRHHAALYARRDQRHASLSVADVSIHLPDYEESLTGVINGGGAVFVVDADLATLDVPEASLCPGVTTIAVRDLPELLERYDAVWYL
jgi:sulfur relay (sulfurtransferase) DsrF/TusC family protein